MRLTTSALLSRLDSGQHPDILAASSILALWLSVLVACPAPVAGQETAPPSEAASRPGPADPDRPYTISLRWENDVVGGTDGDYSNGLALTFSRDTPGPLGGVWKWFGERDGRLVTSYEVGQLIVTPRDIRREIPDPADRPYAGLLYVAVSTQAVHRRHLHGLRLIAGVVGPASLAAETQRAVHRLTGAATPQGWDHQLKNEPILNVAYEHRRRHIVAEAEDGWGADAIPLLGGMLGNAVVQARANGQVRFGYHLPDDFGTSRVRNLGDLPSPDSSREPDLRRARPFRAYAFAGGGMHLVARDLTLDGNTFEDGPRVEKRSLFPTAEVGVSVWMRWFEATFTYVFWGREYEAQPQASRFGAIAMKFRF